MINMKSAVMNVCFAFLLLLALTELGGQTIALHPLKGSSPDATKTFFNEIVKALDEFPGTYSKYLINLEDDETLDVSTGGYPAYICPQEILTKGSPYAITGEVTGISGSAEMYELRLYLWDMEFRTLIISDELIVYGGGIEAKYLPQLLAWMLSWINRIKIFATGEDKYFYVEKEIMRDPEKVIVYVDREIEVVPVEPLYWLRLGLKLGAGDSQWHFTFHNDIFEKTEKTIHFLNGGLGLQAAMDILPWLAIQTEVNFSVDVGLPQKNSPTNGTFVSSYLTIPLLARFNWYQSTLMASIYLGPYFYQPLFEVKNEDIDDNFSYKPQIPGFMVGVSIGWKKGPGYLFADARFKFDGKFWKGSKIGQPFYRNVAKLSIGYELPFFKKKPKETIVADTSTGGVALVQDTVEEALLSSSTEVEK
jgi:hypothetical protein